MAEPVPASAPAHPRSQRRRPRRHPRRQEGQSRGTASPGHRPLSLSHRKPPRLLESPGPGRGTDRDRLHSARTCPSPAACRAARHGQIHLRPSGRPRGRARSISRRTPCPRTISCWPRKTSRSAIIISVTGTGSGPRPANHGGGQDRDASGQGPAPHAGEMARP